MSLIETPTAHLASTSNSPVPSPSPLTLEGLIRESYMLDHIPPEGRTFEDVSKEKAELYEGLVKLADRFDGASAELVKVAARCAMRCHFNHFRTGGNKPHYGIHLAGVCDYAIKNFDEISGYPEILATSPSLQSKQPEVLDPKAVAVAVAMLHDTIEDTIKSLPDHAPIEQIQQLVKDYLQREVSSVIGAKAAATVLRYVENLTIYNNHEYPEDSYIAQNKEAAICRIVKTSDVLHNISTAPGVMTVYPNTIVAAQSSALFDGTPMEKELFASIYTVLGVRGRDEETSIKRNWKSYKSFRNGIEQIIAYSGEKGLERLYRFHCRMAEKIASREFAYLSDPEAPEFDPRIDAQFARQSQSYLLEILKVKVDQISTMPTSSEELISSSGESSTRLLHLGPETMWGADIKIAHKDLPLLREFLNECSRTHGAYYPGYIVTEGDYSRYHISRYPRRPNELTRSLAHCNSELKILTDTLDAADISYIVNEEKPSLKNSARVLLGLEEGYFDQWRLDAIRLAKEAEVITSTTQLIQFLDERVGNLSKFNIDSGLAELPLPKAISILESASFSCIHHFSEVSDALGDIATCNAARILSVMRREMDGKYSVRPYEEDAVIIEFDYTPDSFSRVVSIASQMRQARFSLELIGRMESYMVEIVNFSANAASQIT